MSMADPKIYACDFETTTASDYAIDGEVRVYLWHMRDLATDEAIMGTSIEDWFGWFERMEQNTTMWFHNAAFDCSFIMYHALAIGMTCESYSEKKGRLDAKKDAEKAWLKSNNKDLYYLASTGKRCKTRIPDAVTEQYCDMRNSFEIVKAGSRLIQMVMTNDKGWKLSIYDSGNKYTTCKSLEDIATQIGEPGKTYLDVYKRRGPDYVATEEDIARVANDTRILRKAMILMYDGGLTSPTLAADAWKIWHSMYVAHVAEEKGMDEKEALKYVDGFVFPKIKEKMTYDDGTVVNMRDAYYGGRVYLDPKYKDVDLKHLSVVDCNSMHPHQMRNKPMPYGKPWRSVDKPESLLYIIQFHCRFKLKPGKDPTYQRNKSFRSIEAEWVYESYPDGETVTITSIDLEIFLEHYDVEGFEYATKYYLNFNWKAGEFFTEYIDLMYNTKEESKDAMKECYGPGVMIGDREIKEDKVAEYLQLHGDYYRAKILMNGLYGKFGQDPEKPYQWAEMEADKSKVRIKESDIEKDEYFSMFGHKYLPVAIFVTAWSRKMITEAYEKIGGLYCDTDCVQYIDDGREIPLELHPSKIGAWDVEHKDMIRGRYLRAKTYMLEDHDGSLIVKCGGMPDKVKKHVTWENFHPGLELPPGTGKLLPTKVKGGTALMDIGYKISG